MDIEDLIREAEGLGKGLGSIGAKISKSAGLPGVDVSGGSKALSPNSSGGTSGTTPKLSGGSGNAGMPPEGQEPIDTTPETVEALPEAEPMEFDRLGSPDKNHLTGHIVKWGGKDHILDWDADYEVYKVVNPITLRVKTRIKPESISVIDYKPETVKESILRAVDDILGNASVDYLVDRLLESADLLIDLDG